MSRVAINDLLRIFSTCNPQLPLKYRTLLHTPRSYSIKRLDNGEYAHMGLGNGLQLLIYQRNIQKK